MRKSQEIDRAIAILQKKGDKLSNVQIEILKNRRNEVWAFEHYIKNSSNTNRDEVAYCAARDAAKYLNGKLGLAELIPNVEVYTINTKDVTEQLPSQNEMWKMIKELTNRVELLEMANSPQKDFNIHTPNQQGGKQEFDDSEYMLQSLAYKYIGCSLTTLKSWKKKGAIPFYRKGGRIYFKKSDIDNNPVLNQYKSKYK